MNCNVTTKARVGMVFCNVLHPNLILCRTIFRNFQIIFYNDFLNSTFAITIEIETQNVFHLF